MPQVKYEPRDSYDHYSGGGESASMRGTYGQQQQQAIPHHQQQLDPRLYNQHQQLPAQLPLQTAPQLEQAQKAQQILSMLTHGGQQQVPPQVSTSPYQQNMNLASPTVPAQPHLLQQPFVQPVPPTEDQASQVQQLLGLLVIDLIYNIFF